MTSLSSSSSSSSSQAKHLSFINITCLLFIIFLLVSSCSATRPGATLMGHRDTSKESENVKPYRRLYETSFRHRNHIFNFLPKGVPVPPSGPSKRHNSIQN
ncbi:PROTEIN IDA-LIKE 5 [Salix viminalis]|uniref:PROTEIN IDA-LIKE 5 n=1 Tax=Salix viminalis TaxID=40686 RepID=A0A9Q0U0B3_SALVM|nr:PROTEIN IDA-LIKE 5 [Salix viminalis]